MPSKRGKVDPDLDPVVETWKLGRPSRTPSAGRQTKTNRPGLSCDTCGTYGGIFTMSYFDERIICEQCEAKEVAHPLYPKARAVEAAAVVQGDYYFPGIGRPPDLE